MRAFDIALAALALRTAATRSPPFERRIVPAQDEPNAALLDRQALPQQRAALIASLWPEPTRQCAAAPVYLMLPAPAAFGRVNLFTWTAPRGGVRGLQHRLAEAFAAPAATDFTDHARAA